MRKRKKLLNLLDCVHLKILQLNYYFYYNYLLFYIVKGYFASKRDMHWTKERDELYPLL